MGVTIKKVADKSDLKKFIRFNYELYKDNEYAVPELYSDMVNTLSDKNAALKFCKAEYFLAYKDGKLAGRVAAIINPHANERWNEKTVRFGFIDFIEDREVAKALLDAVEQWGKQHGMNKIAGPLGFTDFDPEGALTEGYDQLGTISSIYNYPYYIDYYESLGFEKETDWVEFKIYVPKEMPEKHRKIAEIVMRKYELSIKKYTDGKKLVREYGRAIFELLNESYQDLYGFAKLTPEQIDQYINMYLPMVDLDMLTVIVDKEGTLVGVGISMPSLSIAFQKAKGKLFPMGWYHILKALKSKKHEVIDLLLVAVKPEYQNKGVNALLFYDLIPVFQRKGVVYAESNPELEHNGKVQAQWAYFDYVQHKRRRAYGKHID